MNVTHAGAKLHVRYDGKSWDLPLSGLEWRGTIDESSLKRAVARTLDLPASGLRDHVVERHVNGNWTLRPPAVYG